MKSFRLEKQANIKAEDSVVQAGALVLVLGIVVALMFSLVIGLIIGAIGAIALISGKFAS